jgi:hypothetical protein
MGLSPKTEAGGVGGVAMGPLCEPSGEAAKAHAPVMKYAPTRMTLAWLVTPKFVLADTNYQMSAAALGFTVQSIHRR